MSTAEPLPPNFGKLDVALRSIGYSFEMAVADIVDNSIDENAERVLIRLFITEDGHLDLLIWDDGNGMSAAELREAMRFGADVSRDTARLGKFGLGLKLASLSQAREVRVVSVRNGAYSGRAWLEDGITKGFSSTVFDDAECASLVQRAAPDIKSWRAGTLVWWSRLYRIGHHHGDVNAHAQKLMHRLESHLSLVFHRFLSGKVRKVVIALDIYDETSKGRGIPIELDALDPFAYPRSGHRDFPQALHLDAPFKDSIAITAHVWPANSSVPEYKLPGGANHRQGFYFYRNNRLIQGGGWNGLRETEPHASLARLEIDISPNLDIEMNLDVKKVEIQIPSDLAAAIQKARTPSGIDLKKYLAIANEAYRKRDLATAELPLIPTSGIPADLVRMLREQLQLESTEKFRELTITWAPLDEDLFFDVDRANGRLLLNRSLRRILLHGLSGSATDVPVLKCLLFFVLEDALSSGRMGARIRERTELINRVLLQAVKHERSHE